MYETRKRSECLNGGFGWVKGFAVIRNRCYRDIREVTMSSIHSKRKNVSNDMAAGVERARKLSERVTEEQIEHSVATSTAVETGEPVEKIKRRLKKSKTRRFRPKLHEEKDDAS